MAITRINSDFYNVDVLTIKSVNSTIPIDSTKTIIGSLPQKYSPQEFIESAKSFIYHKKKDRKITFIEEDCVNYIIWFENRRGDKNEYTKLNVYAFALAQIGLFPWEQKDRLKIYCSKDSLMNTITRRRPTAKWYPRVIPFELFELLRLLPENQQNYNRDFKYRIKQQASILSLLYYIDKNRYYSGKRLGEAPIPLTYFEKRLKSDPRTVLELVDILQLYNLLICTHSPNKEQQLRNNIIDSTNSTGITRHFNPESANHWTLTLRDNISAFPLVFPSRALYTPKTPNINVDEKIDLLYGSNQSFIFNVNRTARNRAQAKLYKSRGIYAFIHKKAGNTTGQPAEKWHVFNGVLDLIYKSKDIIEAKASTIPIDRNMLRQEQANLEKMCDNVESGTEGNTIKIKTQLKQIKTLLERGICDDYDFTDSGRLKSPGWSISPLTASKNPNKITSILFRSIEQDLYELDLTAADILSGTLITGCKHLFNDYLSGSFYKQIMKSLDIEGTKNNLFLVKKIALSIQNMGGAEGTYNDSIKKIIDLESWKKLFTAVKEYLNRSYPEYYIRLREFITIGAEAKRNRKHPPLPNGFGLILKKVYAASAHVVQSVTKAIISLIFDKLEESGYDLVFEIHDSVVSRKPISYERANQIARDIIRQVIEELGYNWQIPNRAVFVKTGQIETRSSILAKEGKIIMHGKIDASSDLSATLMVNRAA